MTITLDFQELARRYLTALLEGDRREAMRIVFHDALHKGARVVDVMALIIRAAQLELGALWQANRVSIGEEHMATGISQITLAHLLDSETPADRNGKLEHRGAREAADGNGMTVVERDPRLEQPVHLASRRAPALGLPRR